MPSPLITAHQGRGTRTALLPPAAGQRKPHEVVCGGLGVTVTFAAPTPGAPLIGIVNCEEGRCADGKWRHLRWLNGVQTHQGRHLRLEPGRFTLQRIHLYRY